MRGLIFVAAALAVAAGSTARAADAAKPLVDLTRVKSSIPVGQTVGDLQAGLMCIRRGDVSWEPESEASFATETYRTMFRDAMKERGLNVPGSSTDLFESHSANVDLQVGALITSFHQDVCAKSGGGKVQATTSIRIQWQIYSVIENKVIARVETSGFNSGSTTLAADETTRAAFRECVRALAYSEAVSKLLAARDAPPVVAESAKTPLSLTLPTAGKSVALADAAKAVVSIYISGGWGSGVLISPEGYLLTNHHVAGDEGQVRIRWADGSETVGEVVRADKARDVALVKTTPPKIAALAIRRTPVQLGETVYAIGTPLEKEFAGTLTRGVVSAVHRTLRNQDFIQSDVAIDHGNSGGPLLDESGHVVGLTDLAYAPDDISKNINFFIPIDDALKVLALTPAAPQASEPHPAAPGSARTPLRKRRAKS